MDAETLKPCPFCNGPAKVMHHTAVDYWYGSCLPCDAEGPPRSNSLDAATAWNERAPTARDELLRLCMQRMEDSLESEGPHEPEWSKDDRALVEEIRKVLP